MLEAFPSEGLYLDVSAEPKPIDLTIGALVLPYFASQAEGGGTEEKSKPDPKASDVARVQLAAEEAVEKRKRGGR